MITSTKRCFNKTSITSNGSLHRIKSRIFDSLVGSTTYCWKPRSQTESKNTFCDLSCRTPAFAQSILGQFRSPTIRQVVSKVHNCFKQSVKLTMESKSTTDIPL